MNKLIAFLILAGSALHVVVFGQSQITSQTLADANVDFNLALLRDFYANGGSEYADSNIFYSAYSINQALSMLMLGARGSTFDQLLSALQFTKVNGVTANNQGALHAAISDLAKALRASAKVTINIGNGGYPSTQFKLNPDFVSAVSNYYSAVWRTLDFARNPEGATATINKDIAKATNGKILDLIPVGALGPSTALVLTNAIYFKGNWKTAFDKRASVDLPFYLDDGATDDVKMMQDTRNVLYAATKVAAIDVEAIELPYVNENIVMVYVLPPQNSIKNLVLALTSGSLNEIRKGMSVRKTDIALPILKTDTTINLKAYLMRLGLLDIFGNNANLSGLVASGGQSRLAVNEVYHKAYVTINEEGTEAAAATAVVVALTSFQFNNEFKANRPFLYFLLDKASGTVLFSGTYVKVN